AGREAGARGGRHPRGAGTAGGGSGRGGTRGLRCLPGAWRRGRSTRTDSTTRPERVAALVVGHPALGAAACGRAGGQCGGRHERGADGVDGARDAGGGPATAGDGVWAHLNAECGVRNAELQGKVVRGTTPTLIFRIPNSALRTRFSPCPTSTSTSPSASAAAPTAISRSPYASASRRGSTWTPCSRN